MKGNFSLKTCGQVMGAAFLAMLLGGCGFFSWTADPGPPPKGADKIVRKAWSQMGKKYRVGGASPQKGFDCSGLVWWSYRQCGIKVPRITTGQAKAGKPVSRKAARPGDIVVFRTGNSPRGLHTGIYAGNDRFIHSPSSGKRICMEKISGTHWGRKLASLRRISR